MRGLRAGVMCCLVWVGAGLTVTMDVTVLGRAKSDGPPFERAHFAAGCFWVRDTRGGEGSA